jgi:hypothetical protein
MDCDKSVKFISFIIIAVPFYCNPLQMTCHAMRIVGSAVIGSRILSLGGYVHTSKVYL